MHFIETIDMNKKCHLVNLDRVISMRSDKHMGGELVTIIKFDGDPENDVWVVQPTYAQIKKIVGAFP